MAYFSPLSALILKHTGEEVVAEYRFHSGRDWRFDFAIPSRRVAVEVEGGAFNGGRHIRINSAYLIKFMKSEGEASFTLISAKLVADFIN